MEKKKYESPEISVVSMEPDENLMDYPGIDPGVTSGIIPDD